MLSLAKTKTMTVEEFMENYRQKYEMKQFAKKIKSNKRLEKMFVFVTASIMNCQTVLATSKATKGIDTLGIKLLGVTRTVAYWICLLGCILEICKTLMQGDYKSIGKIIVKYTIAFSAIYFVPWVFDIIKDSF